jgi:hypothetical protein
VEASFVDDATAAGYLVGLITELATGQADATEDDVSDEADPTPAGTRDDGATEDDEDPSHPLPGVGVVSGAVLDPPPGNATISAGSP